MSSSLSLSLWGSSGDSYSDICVLVPISWDNRTNSDRESLLNRHMSLSCWVWERKNSVIAFATRRKAAVH